jgi:hypothetical protein
MTGLQVDKILDAPNKSTGLDKVDNNHIKTRTGAKKAFYNNNSFAVFEDYIGAILYDIHTAMEIYSIHTLLSAKATKEILGKTNTAKFYERAKHSVAIARRKVSKYGPITRWLEKHRGNVLVGQVANLGQWVKQVGSMIPANIIMNPKGAMQLPKLLTKYSMAELDAWFHKNGAGIQKRDVFMEKLGSPLAYSNTLEKMQEKSENYGSFAIRKADAFSARINFMSAFLEKSMAAGQTMEEAMANPKPELIAQAEFITDIVQNVSDPSFAGTAWNPGTGGDRLIMSTAYHLKTFAVNYALGAIGGIRYAKDSSMARKLVAQAYLGSAIFGMLTEMFRDMTKATFGLEDDDDRDAFTRYATAAAVGAVGDLLFAILPSMIESGVKGTANDLWKGFTETDRNLFYADPSMRAGTGGFSEIWDVFSDTSTFLVKATQGDFEDADLHDSAKIASYVLSFVRFPMRGDIKRGLDAWHRKKEQEKKKRNKAKKVLGGKMGVGG